MKRMMAYSANISGSDPYWYKRRRELEATFEQKGCATVFYYLFVRRQPLATTAFNSFNIF